MHLQLIGLARTIGGAPPPPPPPGTANTQSVKACRGMQGSRYHVGTGMGISPLLAYLSSPTDIHSAGAWPLLSNLEDPELRRPAAGLAVIVFKQSGRWDHKVIFGG